MTVSFLISSYSHFWDKEAKAESNYPGCLVPENWKPSTKVKGASKRFLERDATEGLCLTSVG